MNANTAGIKHHNESNAVQILLFQNSPVPHQRAWSQAITLEQILDLIWASRSDIDIKYVRLQNNRFFFLLKISKEVGKEWRKSNTREPYTPFSASSQNFCVTAHAYLNTPKSADGQFWSLHKHVCVPKKCILRYDVSYLGASFSRFRGLRFRALGASFSI